MKQNLEEKKRALNHSSWNVPALTKRRVGSLKGTTGLDFQLTWFLSWKKLKKVSLTRFAGHSTSWVSAPGMAAAEDDGGEWKDLTARKGATSESSGGGERGYCKFAYPDFLVGQLLWITNRFLLACPTFWRCYCANLRILRPEKIWSLIVIVRNLHCKSILLIVVLNYSSRFMIIVV